MARNGSGSYSKVNTFVAGTTITASGHNQNWDDIATEMTNSVAADGQTTMTGPLKASNGTVSAPALTFAADTNTGVYRIGADNLGVAVGGSKVLDVSSTGLDVTGTINSSGAVKQAGFVLMPCGIILPYAGSSAPTGFLLCYGQSLLRTSYPDLFTAIGTTFGAADGTHFSLPDLRGRNVAGKDDMGGSAASRLSGTSITTGGATTLGGAGGSETKTLVTANLPPYTPAGTIGSMSGNAPLPARNFTTSGTSVNEVSLGSNVASSAGTLNVGLNSLSATFTGTAQGGTSTAFAIVQPTLILNYIIFAGV